MTHRTLPSGNLESRGGDRQKQCKQTQLLYEENRVLTWRRKQRSTFFNINLFIYYLFLAALGLCCCARAFSSCGEWGLLFVAVSGLLIAVASLAVEYGLQARGLQQLQHIGSVIVAHGLSSAGSVVVVHGLSCFVACGIFPHQGSNPCTLHWQADS